MIFKIYGQTFFWLMNVTDSQIAREDFLSEFNMAHGSEFKFLSLSQIFNEWMNDGRTKEWSGN